MKEYNLKFGLEYYKSKWHVVDSTHTTSLYISDCNDCIPMGYINFDPSQYIYPITDIIGTSYKVDSQLKYKNLCKKCRIKHQLTEEDINHYIVLAKFGIKI